MMMMMMMRRCESGGVWLVSCGFWGRELMELCSKMCLGSGGDGLFVRGFSGYNTMAITRETKYSVRSMVGQIILHGCEERSSLTIL